MEDFEAFDRRVSQEYLAMNFFHFIFLGRHYVYAFKVRNNEDGGSLGRPNTDKQMEVGVPIVCTLGVMFEHPPPPPRFL